MNPKSLARALAIALSVSTFSRADDTVTLTPTTIELKSTACCSLGAAAVFWFVPMLIGFGMCIGGTASVVLREVKLIHSCSLAI